MIGWSYLHRWQENENNKNKILLELLAKQSASSVNKEEQPVSQNAPVTQENVGQKEPPKPAETKKNK